VTFLLLRFACICPGALLSPDRRVQIIKPVIIENNTTYIVSEIEKGIRCELSIIIDFSVNGIDFVKLINFIGEKSLCSY